MKPKLFQDVKVSKKCCAGSRLHPTELKKALLPPNCVAWLCTALSVLAACNLEKTAAISRGAAMERKNSMKCFCCFVVVVFPLCHRPALRRERNPRQEKGWIGEGVKGCATSPRQPAACREAKWHARGGDAARQAAEGHKLLEFRSKRNNSSMARPQCWCPGGQHFLAGAAVGVFLLQGDVERRKRPWRTGCAVSPRGTTKESLSFAVGGKHPAICSSHANLHVLLPRCYLLLLMLSHQLVMNVRDTVQVRRPKVITCWKSLGVRRRKEDFPVPVRMGPHWAAAGSTWLLPPLSPAPGLGCWTYHRSIHLSQHWASVLLGLQPSSSAHQWLLMPSRSLFKGRPLKPCCISCMQCSAGESNSVARPTPPPWRGHHKCHCCLASRSAKHKPEVQPFRQMKPLACKSIAMTLQPCGMCCKSSRPNCL